MNSNNETYLLLGANLGDRLHYLQEARKLIAEKIGTLAQSSGLYETEPWGISEQPAYLNQALKLSTSLPPAELMQALLLIERELGRSRSAKWEPRNIDIDILFYGNSILNTPDLVIPHPELHRRNFALIPLLEIAPELLHPVLGKTIEELFDESQDPLDVMLFEAE
jgi:2-amino-4-hydroxy-6-hydroxymethyldihydropteridine diphosphokinase